MTEEEKKEESSEKKEEQTTEEGVVDEGNEATESEGTESTSKEIDYKALAEQERGRREKAEKALAELAYKKRETKREGQTEETSAEDGGEEKPLTRSEIADIIATERISIQKEVKHDKILGLMRANTRSEDEAQAALEFYRSRIIPTGDDTEDALAAIAVLNYPKLAAKSVQLAKALRSKETARNDSGSAVQEGMLAAVPKLSTADAEAIKKAGFVWDGNKKLFKKKLSGSKHLYYDPKRNKRWAA